MSETHATALEEVISAVRSGTACTVLTGQPGIGKTTVLNAAVAALAVGTDALTILKVSQPLPPPLEFQKLIGAPLGLIDADRMTPNEIARRLGADEGPAADRRVVLMVDDAQRLPPATLLYLRLVSDLFCVRAPRLQVVLVGRPPLLDILQRSELAGRFVETAVHAELKPLSAMEMSNYIAYRLGVSGCTLRGSFARGALRLVIADADGIPRRADQVLQRAMQRGPDGLSRPITLKMLNELGLEASHASLPAARGLWAALAGAGVVAVVAAGLVAWQGVDESRDWLMRTPQLASQWAGLAMGRGMPPTVSPERPASAPIVPLGPAPAPAPPQRQAVAGAVPQPTPGVSDAADGEIARLLQAADAQIAAGHIAGPADDNVILTFQRLNDVISGASQTGRRMVETMNTHFAERARLAEQAGNPEEARRFRQFAGDAVEAPASPPASPPAVPPAPAGAVAPARSPALPPAAPTLEVQPPAAVGRAGASASPRDLALPLNAPTRLSLLYNRAGQDADVRAGAIAVALRDFGFQVGKPFGAERRATLLVVRYFFAEDRDGAALVARRLSSLTGQTASLELIRRDPMPVPGSVEALIP